MFANSTSVAASSAGYGSPGRTLSLHSSSNETTDKYGVRSRSSFKCSKQGDDHGSNKSNNTEPLLKKCDPLGARERQARSKRPVLTSLNITKDPLPTLIGTASPSGVYLEVPPTLISLQTKRVKHRLNDNDLSPLNTGLGSPPPNKLVADDTGAQHTCISLTCVHPNDDEATALSTGRDITPPLHPPGNNNLLSKSKKLMGWIGQCVFALLYRIAVALA